MYNNKILKKLKEKNVEFISEIKYNNIKYIKTIKISKKEIMYIYYEISNDEIFQVEDEKTLNYLRTMYEIKPSDIVYEKG